MAAPGAEVGEEDDDVFPRRNQRSSLKRARKRPRASAQEGIGADIEEDAEEGVTDGEKQSKEEGDVGREVAERGDRAPKILAPGLQTGRSGKPWRQVLKSPTQNWRW